MALPDSSQVSDSRRARSRRPIRGRPRRDRRRCGRRRDATIDCGRDRDGGGWAVRGHETTRVTFPTPIGARCADRDISETAEKMADVSSALRELGARLEEPALILQALSFTGVPSLRMSFSRLRRRVRAGNRRHRSGDVTADRIGSAHLTRRPVSIAHWNRRERHFRVLHPRPALPGAATQTRRVPDSRAALVSPFFAHPVLCRPPDAPSPLLASTTSSADRHRLPDPSVNWVDAAARDSAASLPRARGRSVAPRVYWRPSQPARADRGGDVSRAFRPTGRIRPPAGDRTRLAAMNPAGDEGDPGRRARQPVRPSPGSRQPSSDESRRQRRAAMDCGPSTAVSSPSRETPLAAIAVLSRTRSKDRAKRSAAIEDDISTRGLSAADTESGVPDGYDVRLADDAADI